MTTMRTAWAWFGGALLYLCALPVGCGGEAASSGSAAGAGGGGAGSGGGNAGVGGSSAQADAFCAAVVEPLCSALFACCTIDTKLNAWGGSVQGCHDYATERCGIWMSESFVPKIDAGITELNPKGLSACTAELSAMAAGGDACMGPAWDTLYYDCFGAFEGKLPAGAACDATKGYPHTLCAGGACVLGECKPWVPSGATCVVDEKGPQCHPGEWCTSIGGSLVCSPGVAIGEACEQGKIRNDGCASYTCGADSKCAPSDADALCKSQ